MQSVELYSIALIFYVLVGIGQGVGMEGVSAFNRERSVKGGGGYVLCAALSLVYAVLGLGAFHGGNPLYVFVPLILLWFAGKTFGKTLYPISDRTMASFVVACLLLAIFLYHRFL